ncbi:MAG: radical SAM protein [Chloroflexi bacterium]|nr:radical SAM protein [Chloroflexota bacterium]
MASYEPMYVDLLGKGRLKRRVVQAHDLLRQCDACAWHCPVDRTAGKLGVCKIGVRARVCSYGPHLGEEDPLRGWRGSGTIFFGGCNLKCQYCQNHDISQSPAGYEVDADALAAIMLELQDQGCHNINFVSPSHVAPQILAAVYAAAEGGLRLPLVYNSGGYDSLEMLRLLNGVIDIYMPDMKYADATLARRYSKIKDYPQVNRAAVSEMHRQVGDLQIDTQGLAVRGLLVRHLLLPDNVAGTEEILRFLHDEISPQTYLNLMDQYRPAYRAHRYPELDRPLRSAEYAAALRAAQEVGLQRLDERRALRWRGI